ncbi:MAG: 5-formyltetrahydrofolate cyclo-ligase, partial [Chloroflexota bacterium]|nr:5-formyltetrahydrofolate cyclo-ligase [Chloroflexota bacterium]
MAAQKVDLRARTLAARRQMTAAQRRAAGSAICEALLRLPEMSDVETVAAYVSIGSEPQTADVIRSLRA